MSTQLSELQLYNGFEWKFKNCAQQKEQLEVIRREVK